MNRSKELRWKRSSLICFKPHFLKLFKNVHVLNDLLLDFATIFVENTNLNKISCSIRIPQEDNEKNGTSPSRSITLRLLFLLTA